MTVKNLWGDLKGLGAIRTPKAILEEQATLLFNLTGGVLQGEVRQQQQEMYQPDFIYDFNVVAPTINYYKYTVLSIEHTLDIYPVRVEAAKPNNVFECANENEFERVIGSILSSDEVKTVISVTHHCHAGILAGSEL